MWLWEGQPELSPTLAELVDARIGRAPTSVRGVLDALAVSEPLDADILGNLTGPEAVAEAESLGLVRVDSRAHPAAVWLAHPLFGEVRRTGSLRLRRLRGRIATELARKPTTDPRDHCGARCSPGVQISTCPELLLAAASSAMQLLDLKLAEALAEHAVRGRRTPCQIAHATTIMWQQRGADAEKILVELADPTSGPAGLRLRSFAP
jgi:hypothetical protein